MRAPLKTRGMSILACLAAVSVLTPAHAADRISPTEAIVRAERFIADNGYTSAPPKAVLDPESLEFTGDRGALLEFRHDSLKPNAIGVRAGAPRPRPGLERGVRLYGPARRARRLPCRDHGARRGAHDGAACRRHPQVLCLAFAQVSPARRRPDGFPRHGRLSPQRQRGGSPVL